MYKLNSFEKEYSIEELKQDWLFKLLCKFLKQHGLFNAMTKRKEFFTMHSNNYCMTKMFFLTISVTVPRMVMSGMVKCQTYDKLWTEFIAEHLECIPSDIKDGILNSKSFYPFPSEKYDSLETFINMEYRKHYYEERPQLKLT